MMTLASAYEKITEKVSEGMNEGGFYGDATLRIEAGQVAVIEVRQTIK